MQSFDITDKVKSFIRFGLVAVIAISAVIGCGGYKLLHKDEVIVLDNAKVAGTMVSVRVLTNGKVKELLFDDGAEVKAGNVIAALEVSVTEEELKQLEDTVQLAKDKYAELQAGQTVTVPVQRERVVYPPAPPPTSAYSAPSGNLAKLEERANRMAELFEMGAVSAVQRDAARRAYESALAESQSGSYQYSAAPAPIIEYYTEYVEEFRPTPPEVLEGAAQAIKQAELSLNVARQEARETNVVAPVSGTIYYGVEVDQELVAGDSVSKIGDSRELWIEAEVSEDIFNKIPLGKLVSYSIDDKELFGTVIEKIKPNISDQTEENSAQIELPEIPTTENQPAAMIEANTPQEISPTEEKIRSIISSVKQNPQIVEAESEIIETPSPETQNRPTEENQADNAVPKPQITFDTQDRQKPNDKFIIKISLPSERDFDCRPNTKTTVKIKI